MTKGKIFGRRAMAFVLCVLMMFTMFIFTPVTAEAQPIVQPPTDFQFDVLNGYFSWIHAQTQQLPNATYQFEIQSAGNALWRGSGTLIGARVNVNISELNLDDSLPLRWDHAMLPEFPAHVVAVQTVGAVVTTSAISNAVPVRVRTDIGPAQIINIDGTQLTWGPRPAGTVLRIYVGGVFSTAFADARVDFDLSTLGLIGSTQNISVRVANPFAFSISPHSNILPFTPAAQGFPITLSAQGAGNVTSTPHTAAPAGANVVLTAIPNPSSSFSRWEVLAGGITIANITSPTVSFTMPNNAVSIRGIFDAGHQITVTRNYYNLGTATANVAAAMPGALVTLTATPTAGNRFLRWDVISGNATLENPESPVTQFPMPDNAVQIMAVFTSGHGVVGGNLGQVPIHHTLHSGVATLELPQNVVSSIISFTTGSTAIIDLTNIGAVESVIVPRTALYRFLNELLEVEFRVVRSTGQYHSIFLSRDALDSLLLQNTDAYISIAAVPQPPSQPPPPVAIPFVDVNSNQWFYEHVVFVFSNNLMGPTATSPMVFSPNANLSRAMIVTILHRREGTPTPHNTTNPFIDVPYGQWFTEAIIWAEENGIVTGFGGRFNPNANISRQDLAVILMRYADFADATLPNVADYRAFIDQAQIQAYAVPAVRQAVEAGIITGRAGNLFAPLDNSTRAEAAAMLHRFIEAIS